MKKLFVFAFSLLLFGGYAVSDDLTHDPTKNNMMIEEEKARLELAIKKTDLDQMYLSLRKLKVLVPDDRVVIKELSKLETAISLYEQVKLHQSDHNHEGVVKSAGLLLDYYPDHIETRKAFKESGLILLYLKAAVDALSNCLMFVSDGGQDLLNILTVDGNVKSIDQGNFNKLVFYINEADKNIKEAKNLDPQFEKAIDIHNTVTSFKNTNGLFIATCCVLVSNTMVNGFYSLYDAYNSLISKYYGKLSPAEIWNGVGHLYDKALVDMTPLLSFLINQSALLSQLNIPKENKYVTIIGQIATNTHKFVNQVCHPTGNIFEYRRSVNNSYGEHINLTNKLKVALPNEDKITQDLKQASNKINSYEIFRDADETNHTLNRHKKLLEI